MIVCLCFMFFQTIIVSGSGNLTFDNTIYPKLSNYVLVSNNKQCVDNSYLYLNQLNNLTFWAYEVFDATSSSVTGILSGNVYHFGDWDECLNALAPFETQYCLTKIYIEGLNLSHARDQYSIDYTPYESVLNKLYKKDDSSQIRRDLAFVGICLPASCAPSDIENSLNNQMKDQRTLLTIKNISYSVEVSQNLCQRANDLDNFNTIDIAFCVLVGLLICLLFCGTIFDYMKNKEKKKENGQITFLDRILISFSARKNFVELMRNESKSSLNVLNGIKVISICMIILDHRFGTFTSGPVLNFGYIEKEYKTGAAFAIFHGDLFVDSFFVLSGILVAYVLLNQFEKKMVNPLHIFVVRYFRLVPSYAFVIFFYASVLENTGSGPLWKLIIGPEANDCRKNWWLSLLFLSNYINDENMCMVHSWYLPCDFHYFIVATFTIRILKNHKRIGFSILILFLILSTVIPFILTVVYERPATLLFYPDFLVAPKAHPDFRLTYTKSHTRASPYIIGLFAGYLYHKLKGSNWKFEKVHSHLLTFISTVLLIGGLGSGAVFYQPYHPYNAIESGIYAGLHRIVWALGTVGLLFTATHGYSTLITCVLDCRVMNILGKLVYGVYIIHMQFALRSVAATRTSKYLSISDMAPLVFGDMVIAFVSALALYLLIEMPFRRIFKELFIPHISKTRMTFDTSIKENIKTREKIIENRIESRL